MNVLILNSVDNCGGAAKVAQRLCLGLRQADIPAHLLVQRKLSDESCTIGPTTFFRRWFAELRPHLDALPTCLYPKRTRLIFSPGFLPERTGFKINSLAPDLLHLHWICEGFVRIETLRTLKIPIVWTLHDSWPFTGGCHLPFDCTRYEGSCGCCPRLGSGRTYDLSRWVWRRKRKTFSELDLVLVAPSSWMAKCVKASSLFRNSRVEVIPNGLDLLSYSPRDKWTARSFLNLPHEKRLILFNGLGGCDNPNKGFGHLREALRLLLEMGESNLEVVVIGSSLPKETGMPIRSLGRLSDDVSIALAYAAADVTVVPSLQENLPNTVMESMACGTPCVAFRIGGIPDLIDHRENGFLAEPYRPEGVAEGIRWVLADEARLAGLAARGRQKIEAGFSLEAMTARYVRLYEELLAKRRAWSES